MIIGTAASILIPNVGQNEPIIMSLETKGEEEDNFDHVPLDDFPDTGTDEDDFK
jgi:hypothetical protein